MTTCSVGEDPITNISNHACTFWGEVLWGRYNLTCPHDITSLNSFDKLLWQNSSTNTTSRTLSSTMGPWFQTLQRRKKTKKCQQCHTRNLQINLCKKQPFRGQKKNNKQHFAEQFSVKSTYPPIPPVPFMIWFFTLQGNVTKIPPFAPWNPPRLPSESVVAAVMP